MSARKHKIQHWREDRINGRQRCIVNESGGRITYIDDDCRYGAEIAAVPERLERIKNLERDMRAALAMLERAQYGCQLPGSGPLADEGPVEQSFAIGWAKGALRRALGLSDQP